MARRYTSRDCEPTAWGEIGADNKPGFLNGRHNFKFHPSLSGDFHFRAEQETLIFREVFDTPEVDYIARL